MADREKELLEALMLLDQAAWRLNLAEWRCRAAMRSAIANQGDSKNTGFRASKRQGGRQ